MCDFNHSNKRLLLLELNAPTVCLQRGYAPAGLSATGMQSILISLAFRPRIDLYILFAITDAVDASARTE